MLKTLSLMAFVAIGLAGCTTGADRSMVTGSIRPNSSAVVAPTLVSEVAPEYAIAYLPNVAGPIAGIRQSSAREKVTQTILYPASGYGEGENALEVTVTSTAIDSRYYLAPTLRDLQIEMNRKFPGVAMKIVQVPGENLSGVFGYGIGQSASAGTCIFGWQTVRDASSNDKQGIARFSAHQYAAKVRLRYCSRTMPEQALVALMRGLRLRDVNNATMDMLRFAEGSGTALRATPQAFVAPAPVTVAAAPAPESRPRPVRRVTETVVEDTSAIDIPRAPKVLAPKVKSPRDIGVTAETSVVEVPRPRVAAVAEAVKVPLPKAVAN